MCRRGLTEQVWTAYTQCIHQNSRSSGPALGSSREINLDPLNPLVDKEFLYASDLGPRGTGLTGQFIQTAVRMVSAVHLS